MKLLIPYINLCRLATVLLTLFLVSGAGESCSAAIYSICLGNDKSVLISAIEDAEQKIDVRCITIDDPTVVSALKKASEHGVRVRMVVDFVSPLLKDAVRTGNSNLEVRALGLEHHGRFLVPSDYRRLTSSKKQASKDLRNELTSRTQRYMRSNPLEATVDIDRIRTWQGVARLSPGQWIDISTVYIYTQYPAPVRGTDRFVSAWDHSKTVDAQ